MNDCVHCMEMKRGGEMFQKLVKGAATCVAHSIGSQMWMMEHQLVHGMVVKVV
ncbi:hypothetical protein C1H46_042899 [Malus baccata]|uniref:Uncharacterized protein n=1 Tax=Malus baccata TaxID=106549 RepID=A0A540KBF9_MALBA|nr:hypothetical protein C1H46_042899 [Malus baccata]